jgi:hypothetical protein
MKLDLLDEWLEELVYPADAEDFIELIGEGGQGEPDKPSEHYRKIAFYTKDHKYYLTAIERSDGTDYLGCQVEARKPRAGESWHRGNDLPDGAFTRETWEQIKNKIISYELVKLSVRVPPDMIAED